VKKTLKKSLEEIIGMLLIGIIILIVFVYYLTSSLSTNNNDFNWKKYHLEYIIQVLLNYQVSYTSSCSISFQNMLTNLAISPSKLPSCYLDFISPDMAELLNKKLLKETVTNYFNMIKSPGESFLIEYKFGNIENKIEIKGEINNKEFSFNYCNSKPFSLRAKYVLDRAVTGLDNYFVVKYCKIVY
jgi:hypothetical protein